MTTLNHNVTDSKNDRAFRPLGGLFDCNIHGLMSSSFTAHPGLQPGNRTSNPALVLGCSCGSVHLIPLAVHIPKNEPSAPLLQFSSILSCVWLLNSHIHGWPSIFLGINLWTHLCPLALAGELGEHAIDAEPSPSPSLLARCLRNTPVLLWHEPPWVSTGSRVVELIVLIPHSNQ